MIERAVFSGFMAAALTFGSASAAGEKPEFRIDPAALGVLDSQCLSCHDEDTSKGDIRLDQLDSLDLAARLDLLNKMLEQTFLGQMPPKDKKTQPSESERQLLVDWISRELHVHHASKLEDKLRYPSYGNYVDHEKLFSGKIKDVAFTPARRWLVSPSIFDERVRDVFALEGRDRINPLPGVTNPFILPDTSGVRDYDIGLLDGGSLLVMLTNAEWISQKQIRPAQVKNGEIGANDFPDPKDKWSPRQTPVEFESIILNKSEPTAEELVAAIRKQFELVLRRPPTEPEALKYLELTQSAIQLAGNTEGIRQMLKAVLLESEFLYRQEWGAGAPDEHGRKIISPHEAAYAISYAMGDRGPDAKLLEAAAQGRLNTREDFEREVLRLMEDQTYYHGGIDTAANTGKVTSHAVSHPRIIRFFREFFGYPNAPKIFKDTERSQGIYQNADRGTLGTPGFLVNEADKLIAWCVEQDKNVFETILSTDRFFVFHQIDDKAAAEIVAKWRGVWEALKETEWKTDPEKVVLQHQEMLKTTLGIVPGKEKGPSGHQNTLTRCMAHFEFTFGKGHTPFPMFPWQHGYTLWHTPIYNLPTPPGGAVSMEKISCLTTR
jgi:hypothetical protein